MSSKKKSKVVHWNMKQDIQYYLYLILILKDIARNKKQTKIFAAMARFISNKTSTQCRTHHQKKIKEIKKHYPKGHVELENLKRFYNEFFLIRRLDQDHLKFELEKCLEEKKDQNIINEKEFIKYSQILSEKIVDIMFASPSQLAQIAVSKDKNISKKAPKEPNIPQDPIGGEKQTKIPTLDFSFPQEAIIIYFEGESEDQKPYRGF